MIIGADPNAANSQNLTALHFASSEGHKQALECLLQRGAKPNIVGGPNIRTPLHVSVEENRVRSLLVSLMYLPGLLSLFHRKIVRKFFLIMVLILLSKTHWE